MSLFCAQVKKKNCSGYIILKCPCHSVITQISTGFRFGLGLIKLLVSMHNVMSVIASKYM